MLSPDRASETLAREQHGIITREQALRLGLGKNGITRRIAAGAWIRVHPGVYRLAAWPQSWSSQAMGAVLWLGNDAFLSHRSAVRAHGLQGFEREPRIEVTTTGGATHTSIEIHRLRGKPPALRVLDALPVSRVERTLFDLAGVCPPVQTGHALDDALRKRLTTLERLRTELATHGSKGRRGSKKFAGLLAMRDPRDARVRSTFETRMLRILRPVRPRVVADHEVRCGRRRYFLDLAFPGARVGIECHSAERHMGLEVWKKDVARDRALRLLGWTILYFTWEEVVHAPEEVRRQVEDAISLNLSKPVPLFGTHLDN